MRDNGLLQGKRETKRKHPPRVVTIKKGSMSPTVGDRRQEESPPYYDDISQISIDDPSSWSATMYYRFHPIIWVLLMLMSVGVHSRYQTLLNEPALTILSKLDGTRHRQTSELSSREVRHSTDTGTDLSSLVISLLRPADEDDLPRPLRRYNEYQENRPEASSSSSAADSAPTIESGMAHGSKSANATLKNLPFRPQDTVPTTTVDEDLEVDVYLPDPTSNQMLRGALGSGAVLQNRDAQP